MRVLVAEDEPLIADTVAEGTAAAVHPGLVLHHRRGHRATAHARVPGEIRGLFVRERTSLICFLR